MRAMACQISPRDQLEGFSYIAGVVGAGKHLELLPSGINALEEVYQSPVIKLSELIGTSSKGIQELSHG